MTDTFRQDSIIRDTVNEYSTGEIIGRILSYMQPYKLKVIAALLLSLVSSALFVVRPYLIKVAIDDYIAVNNMDRLQRFMFLFAGVLFLRLIIGYALNMLNGIIGQDVMHDLRMHIFDHILSMDMRFFDRNKVGRLMTRTTDDVANLNELFTSGAIRLINNSAILVGIIVVMFVLDWHLTLITLLVGPLIYIAAHIFARNIRVIYRNIRQSTARLNAFLQESILGVRIIKQMMRTRWSYGRFSGLSGDVMRYKIDNVLHYGLFFPLMEFISIIGVVLVLTAGGNRILSGTIEIGVLVAFLRLVDMFFWPVREMAENFNVMLAAIASSERIFTLLDTESDIREPSAVITAFENPEIMFDHVWFAYEGENWVLKDVSFTVKPGERIAFVGPTGSGKTTIISLILRFYDVTKGRILVNGHDIRNLSLAKLRELFAPVGQEPFLFNRSVSENITLGDRDIDENRIHEILGRIDADVFVSGLEDGLDTIVRERGSRLSQGQKQVVSFSRAMAADRDVLILDEATSNVDTFTDDLIQKAVPVLMEGRTAIVIAHRLSTIRTVDTIHVIAGGRIRESGTHAELLELGGIYASLSKMHFD